MECNKKFSFRSFEVARAKRGAEGEDKNKQVLQIAKHSVLGLEPYRDSLDWVPSQINNQVNQDSEIWEAQKPKGYFLADLQNFM